VEDAELLKIIERQKVYVDFLEREKNLLKESIRKLVDELNAKERIINGLYIKIATLEMCDTEDGREYPEVEPLPLLEMERLDALHWLVVDGDKITIREVKK